MTNNFGCFDSNIRNLLFGRVPKVGIWLLAPFEACSLADELKLCNLIAIQGQAIELKIWWKGENCTETNSTNKSHIHNKTLLNT